MLYNEKHIIKEAEVLVGEIVDDNVLVKQADFASSIASLAGKTKAGSYLSSAVGKQLINRVGTGMAAGAAGGLLTSKEGDRTGGAIKGALLGGAAGGAFHAFDSGALGRFGIGAGKSVESTFGKDVESTLKGKALSKHTPQVQAQVEGLLAKHQNLGQVGSGATLSRYQDMHLSNSGGFGGRAIAKTHFGIDAAAIAPHITDSVDKEMLQNISKDLTTTQYMSGFQKAKANAQSFFGYNRSAVRHNMNLGSQIAARNGEQVTNSMVGGVRKEFNALTNSLDGTPNATGGLLGHIQTPVNSTPSQTFKEVPKASPNVAPAASFNIPQAGQSTPSGIYIPHVTGTTPKVNAPSWAQVAPKAQSAPVPSKFDPNMAARAAKSGIQLA